VGAENSVGDRSPHSPTFNRRSSTIYSKIVAHFNKSVLKTPICNAKQG
jgi:hypothetical protein